MTYTRQEAGYQRKKSQTIPQTIAFIKKECMNFELTWPIKTR